MDRPSGAKLARVSQGLRLIDLELETGINSGKLSLLERGLKQPSPDQAKKLNKILGQRIYDTRPNRRDEEMSE
ncbi:MAG: helix-turn-helix transcriptional regulator [Deltaproteobacteria bacterium]|nr:helix-turn-helix transcriptional regulator [Deltaproteobacteria bacterium]